MFACEHADVSADFMCLSKGLTSGTLPLAVTLTTDKIYKAFYADFTKLKTFYHGHTYTANPIACSAACACLDIFEQENSLARIQPLIGRLNSELNEFRQLNYVGDVRIIGLIAAIELVKNKKTRQGFDFNQRVGFKIYLAGLKKNLILRPLGNIIYFYLPLCLNQNQLSDILARTKKVITHKIRDKG
jgi:adenosylmethionine-8-amino-7-oxononanoate aminotransferase